MSYRNKTYVIFDGDQDIWAYRYMMGWKANKRVDFNFHDAHDLNTISDISGENNTKRKLRARFSSSKQVIVLIGNSTQHQYRFVRWEIEVAKSLSLPIVAVNLNKKRAYDQENCPPILRDADAIHVSFNARIIRYALDNFCPNYVKYRGQEENWYYGDRIYSELGL